MRLDSSAGVLRSDAAVFVISIVGLAALVAALSFGSFPQFSKQPSGQAVPQGLGSFESYTQLQQYIAANAKSAQDYNQHGIFFGGMAFGGVGGIKAPVDFAASMTVAAMAGAAQSPSFTGTNVQVQGVDEPDRVKTDGTHLFVSTQNSVTIINAYPPNSTAVLSTLKFSDATVIGLEIAQDRLVVINQRNTNASYVDLLLYDTSDLASPKLMQNMSMAGNYVAARLAQGFLYAVIQQPSYVFTGGSGNATAVMPTSSVGGVKSTLSPSSVYYTPNRAQVSYYTMIPSINVTSGVESVLSVLTGPSATVYVSTSNIYVVYTNYIDLYMADGIPGDYYSGGVISVQDVQNAQNSTILRASYDSGKVAVAAAGVVPGVTLNQFSLDEYNGFFRVATSRFATIGGAPTTSDDVYVLNGNMSQVSVLSNIAPGENIYAVRFVGEMGYVVTFEQIDPLFVISFKDVAHPVILSALKVSGYSDYLHPLPGGYLIGVGKDAVPSSTGNFAYYMGLKLSLFKVSDNGSSSQVSKLLIGDRGTDSPVLADHLAFTFDPTRNVTVIPLTLYVVSGNQSFGSGIPAYGDPVWQGVYVIGVNTTGFTVLGKVSQYPAGQNYGDSPNSSLQVDRSVIIGNYLYTISQGEVMVSDMAGFSTVATVPLP